MKKKYLYLGIIITFSILSCEDYNKNSPPNAKKVNNTKNFTDKAEPLKKQTMDSIDFKKKWLINFYSEYIKFYLYSHNAKEKSKTTIFFEQLDSIKKKNCTSSFFNHQIKDFNKEFDYITNNEFICEKSLSSLEINRNSTTNDTYSVSFVAEFPLNELESEYRKISFDVIVVTENDVYKISKTCCF